MKLILNGFELELTENENSLTLKILDVNGKELINDTFSQSEITDTVEPVEIPSAEEVEEESLIPTLESLKEKLKKKKSK